MKDIKKNEEVYTIYIGANQNYEERRKKIKETFGFECDCNYCKSEFESIKNSQVKQECENFKNVLKNYIGNFPFSDEYYKIRDFIMKNKTQIHHLDLWTLAIDFDELARKDLKTLKECAELFEGIYDILEKNDFFEALECAQNLAAIYYDLNNYQKCKESYEKMEKNMNSMFPDNPEYVEDFIQKIHKKDENLDKLRRGVNYTFKDIFMSLYNKK